MNKTVLRIRIGLNCVVALLLVGLTADFGGRPLLNVVGTLERQATDWRLARHADLRKNRDIVIVDIDRDSLQSIGNWPWPRGQIAQMLDQLFDKYQVRVATFMFPFVSPDDEGVYIFDEVTKAMNASTIDSQLSELREQFDYDKLLAAAINDRKVILSYFFDNSARVDGVCQSRWRFLTLKTNNAKSAAPIGAITAATPPTCPNFWTNHRAPALSISSPMMMALCGAHN